MIMSLQIARRKSVPLNGTMKVAEGLPVAECLSDPISIWPEIPYLAKDFGTQESSNAESRDTINEPTSYTHTLQNTHFRQSTQWYSLNTCRHSPNSSRPSSPFGSSRPSRLSLASSVTSATVSVDLAPDHKASVPSTRSPSLLSRIRSSKSTWENSRKEITKPSTHPSEFQASPEHPEKHFIDSIGMVIPGVCDRNHCAHPLAHFVQNWRLCEPIEYTTALADHGITYSDYCRLITALKEFVDKIPNEPKRKRSVARWWQSREQQSPKDDEGWQARPHVPRSSSITESKRQYKIVQQQAESLNKLLEDITWNWQKSGLPVMVSISSFSLFAPNRISESHIQILHIPLQSPTLPQVMSDSRSTIRMSFVDPFAVEKSEECCVARPRHNLKRRSVSPHSTLLNGTHLHHHQQLQFRDRTRPWPLWPNAIPSRKRNQMNDHVDRYGVDPYFRAWLRADINSRTKCTSYAKYMIEKEDNPFINSRLEYVTAPSRTALLWKLLKIGPRKWKEQYPGVVNRSVYEHNRRLECRKTVEHGSRLRIVRFAFRHSIYPPHTPEMDELGLTRDAYQTIIDTIEGIRQKYKPKCGKCVPSFLALKSWNKIRCRSTDDARK